MSAAPTLAHVIDQVGANRALAQHRFETAGELEPKPWYVQTAVAIVVWAGALFFASFLAAMGLDDAPVLQVLFAIGFLAGGALAAVNLKGLWRMHACLLCYAGATSMIAFFAARTLHLGDSKSLLATAFAQLACFVVIGARPVRFKALFGASIAFFFAAVEARWALGIDVLLVTLAALTTWVWLDEARLGAGVFSRAVRPAGFALVCALLFLSALTLLGHELRGGHAWITIGGLVALLAVVAWRAARESSSRALSLPVVLALGGVGLLAALASDVPVVLTAILAVALGRMRKEPVLEALGAVALGVFLLWIYRNLDLSLLWTSFALLGAGLALLVGRALLLAGAPIEGARAAGSVLSPVFSSGASRTGRARRGAVVLVPMIAVVAIILGLSARKEALLADGKSVILDLAPVDPRALLQGDYMALNYAAAQSLPYDQREGRALFVRDADGTAHFTRSLASDEQPRGLTEREVVVRWHRVRGRAVFGAESFFFSEGHAEQMARARFAELRVLPDGQAVLVGLLDQSKALLTP